MKKIILSLIILGLIIPVEAQLFFETFANQNEIQGLAEEGNYIWIATSGGVVKRQKSTGALVASYTNSDGLINNDVFGIAIDEQGNKWFATDGGVSKFDGTTWTSWGSGDGLASKYSDNIVIDLEGNVWVGSSNGVSKFDGSEWTAYNITGNGVMDLAVDQNGFVWATTWADGVFVFRGDAAPQNYTTSNSGLLNDIVRCVAVDHDGSLWFGQYNNYIAVFDGDTTWSYYDNSDGFFASSPYDIVIDVSGNKWIGYVGGIYKYDNSSWTQYGTSDGLIYHIVDVIIVDDQGHQWFGTPVGLSRFDEPNFSNFTISSGLPSNEIRSVAHQLDGTTWFGTSKGLVRFKNGAMTTFTTDNSGLPHNSIQDVCTDIPGVVWVATAGGVAMFNGISWEGYTHASTGGDLVDGIIYAIEVDKIGHVWCGAYDGVSVFDGVNWSPRSATKIYDILCANNGHVWLASNGNGVYRYNGGMQLYTTSHGLVSNNCWSLGQDHDDNIWIGHTGSHVTKYNGSTFEKIYLWSMDFGGQSIEGIITDSLHNVWFAGGYSGIMKYDGTNWVVYNTDDGLAHNWTNDINVGIDHHIWVGTDGGVTRISCQNPVPDFSSDIACYPASTTITNLTSEVDATSRYEWDINADGSVEYTMEDITHPFTNHGTYNVKLTAINDHCAESITKQVKVNQMPQASIVPDGSTTICNGSTVTLDAYIANYDGGLDYTYEWTTGANTSFIAPGDAGSYSVTVSHEECSHTPSSVDVSVVEPYGDAEICMVSIDDETFKNMIIWEKPPVNPGIMAYNIYKLFGSSYTIVGQVPFDDLSVYVDYGSNPEAVSARYAIGVVDTCGNESELSSYHQTIHLGASEGALPNQIELNWSEYIDEDGIFAFPYYYIYRGTSVANLSIYDSVSSSLATQYTDIDAQGNIYYRVGVQSPSLCEPTGNLKAGAGPYSHSLSNVEDNRLQSTANEPPADIAIDDNTIDEELPVSSLVGRLTTSDPDTSDQHTYTLVSGTGDTDNSSFIIVSDLLLSAEEFDFETKSSYSVRIRTTDNGTDNLYYEKAFTITVNDISENGTNQAPTDIIIDNSTIDENAIAGTMVGKFSTQDPNTGDSHTYTLVSGTGSTDNANFAIAGNLLLSAEIFDYETKSSYSIRVRSTDDGTGNLYYEKVFTITVNDITETIANQAPTDITLDNNTIAENTSSGTLIGRFISTDPDTSDYHTYTLVPGSGDTNNSSFIIAGDAILSAAIFDFETRSSYSVRVRTTDNGNGNLYYEKAFTITISDLSEEDPNNAPTGININNNSIDENAMPGTFVGRLSTTDDDSLDIHNYSLVPGTGDADNASFTIAGDLLLSAEMFDYETKNSYTVRIRTTDDGEGNLTYEESFTITVINQIDVQVEDQQTDKFLIYPNPFREVTILEFPNPDEEEFRLTIMDLTGKVVHLTENINTGRYELHRDDLPAGYYFIELRGSRVYRGRVIIE